MSLADGRFDLLETMAFDPHEGIRLLELHLARMKVSADALGFAFDRHDVRNELQAATFRLRDRSRVRLLVSRGGALAIEVRAHRTWPQAIVPVAVVPQVVLAEQQVEHQVVMVAEQVQVETEGLQIVVAPEIVVLHPPIPLLVMPQ